MAMVVNTPRPYIAAADNTGRQHCSSDIIFPFRDATLCIFSVLIVRLLSPRILMKYFQAICLLFASISALCCSSTPLQRLTGSTAMPPTIQRPQLGEIPSEQIRSVIESAHEQLSETTHYTQDYKVIHYPG